MSRSPFKLLMIAVAVLTVAAFPAQPQTLKYLPLQQAGQASVAIDEGKSTAYVIDLGKAGDGDQVLVPWEGKDVPLLDFLYENEVKHLVFICSHPHSDHMGGIVATFKNAKRLLAEDQKTPRFASIDIADDGVSNSLFTTLEGLLHGSNIKLGHKLVRDSTGKARNALAELSTPADDVFIETIPYSASEKAGTHGRSVVTRVVLGQKYSVVDFDDADSPTIKKVVAGLRASGKTKIDAFVVPHHGSAYHDIEPILALNPTESVKAVIAVNPENKYRHPAASVLRNLIDKLGPENVIFTGSQGELEFGPDGLKRSTFTAAQRDSYALFVEAGRRWAEKNGSAADLQDYDYIRDVMFRDPGKPVSSPSIAEDSGWLRDRARTTGTTLRSDFEEGEVRNGSTTPSVIRQNRIFAVGNPSSDVVTVERELDSPGNTRRPVTRREAQRAVSSRRMAADQKSLSGETTLFVDSDAGAPDYAEPRVVVQNSDLDKIAAQHTTGDTSTPDGGMVFLTGDKLYVSTSGAQLLGGLVDICNGVLCVKPKSADEAPYVLPFEINTLFAEVWNRVFDDSVNTFYLSINPTKTFLRGLGQSDIPTDRLAYGTSTNGKAPNQVVTAGKIQGTSIGKILWEADVAFKSESLGFDVLRPDAKSVSKYPQQLGHQEEGSPEDLDRDVNERWCRLYWSSGSQTMVSDPKTRKVSFVGMAVTAQSQPMVLKNGELEDYSKGSWCGSSKQVAKLLQREANSSGPANSRFAELRNLAELQTFVRWARDNGLTPSSELTGRIANLLSTSSTFQVPRWTSGIRSNPPVIVQKEVNTMKNTQIVHVSLSDKKTFDECILPAWARQYDELPKEGLWEERDKWIGRGNVFSITNAFMSRTADRIARCSHGRNLSATNQASLGQIKPVSTDADDDSLYEMKNEEIFGIQIHPQPINLHGGILLGSPTETVDQFWRSQNQLVSPGGRLLSRRMGKEIDFWNFSDSDTRFGVVGVHTYFSGATITSSHIHKGRLRVILDTQPGSVVREELRLTKAEAFPHGLEWFEAFNAKDGGEILGKAVWPCTDENGTSSSCVASADVDDRALGTMLVSSGSPSVPPLGVTFLSPNSWLLDLELSPIYSEIEKLGDENPDQVNAQLSALHEQFRWGKMDVDSKYRAALEALEDETQDMVIGHTYDEHKDLDSIIEYIVVARKQLELVEIFRSDSVVSPSLLPRLTELDQFIDKIPPEDASKLWQVQILICQSALEAKVSPATKTKLLALLERYKAMQISSEALISKNSAWTWGSSERTEEENQEQ